MATLADPKNATIDEVNPMGTDGFEFVEYTAPDPGALGALFESMGFSKVAKHRSKDVSLYRQGDVNFIVNAEKESFAQGFARVHGPSVCAIALRVKNAAAAYKRALSLGAWGVEGKIGPMELNIPAIKGIGDSLLYLVDRYGERGSIYDVDFEYLPGVERNPKGVGLTYIDHLTHNVHRGRMDEWADFYGRLQFPRDPLLRHRGQADRPQVQGDDQPVRQDSHPDQREHRRQVADSGIPLRLSRRGHPAHRAGHR
jgi:4-hydroxyphenylpyruvate dioxygenase